MMNLNEFGFCPKLLFEMSQPPSEGGGNCQEGTMRISSDQMIAGYPAIEVRDFLRRNWLVEFLSPAAEFELALSPRAASTFLNKLVALGLLRESRKQDRRKVFQVTNSGLALANASAARPIHRRTAERVLTQFLERLDAVNSTPEYAYRVELVVLFGSMLTDLDRLGDVDVAFRLQPKVEGDAAQEEWSMARRRAAEAKGRTFYGVFEWAMWPIQEVCLHLKARKGSLSLHDFCEVEKMPNLRYRPLLGDPTQISAILTNGQAV
jgi:DNA-binding MarR family transcriptional regulator